MKDLLSSLLRAGAGLKSEQNKHRCPNSHDQKAANQAWTVMGKGSCTHLGRAEQGNDIGGFSLTVSLGSHSLRKQKELKSPKGTLGVMGAAGGDLSSRQAAFWRDSSPGADSRGRGQPVPSPSCPLACFIPGSTDAPRTRAEPGNLPCAAAGCLTCQLSRFSGGTAMGHFWKPPKGLWAEERIKIF